MTNKSTTSYAIRGGLVFLLAYVIVSAALYPFGEPATCQFICFPYWSLPSIIGLGVVSIPLRAMSHNVNFVFPWVIIVPAITYTLFGALTGLIIGAIKNRQHD